MQNQVKTFFDENTYTLTYIVYNKGTKDAIIIDPVLDYDQYASKISYESIDKVLDFVDSEKLSVHYILETHAHADHLSSAAILKDKLPGSKSAIGKNITKVQGVFAPVFNMKSLNLEGQQFDILLDEESVLEAGAIQVRTIFTPGHTPACSSYLIDDMVFTGDALFMPDFGTGRCDFPAGSAKDLYNSIHNKLYSLPDETRVFTGHDYQPNGRQLKFESTIGINKKENIQVKEITKEEEFIQFREERDVMLSAPKLLLPSVQVNIDAGNLPKEEDNGTVYFKLPVRQVWMNWFKPYWADF